MYQLLREASRAADDAVSLVYQGVLDTAACVRRRRVVAEHDVELLRIQRLEEITEQAGVDDESTSLRLSAVTAEGRVGVIAS